MKKLSFYILVIVIMISGCSNNGNTNITDPQNTETAITQTPRTDKEILGSTESTTPNKDSTKTPEPTLPTDPTKTPEPVLPNENKDVLLPWHEKPDYAIDINNYDINGDKEKYLLQVDFQYLIGHCEFDSTNYFVDVNEINQLEGYYEMAGRSIIPEELEPYIQEISEDGQKVVLLNSYEEESIVEIFDLVNHKVLYQYKINKKIPGVGSTSNLEYLLVFLGDGKMILLDVAKDTQKEIDYFVETISPDGTKAVMCDLSVKGNKTLKIYDLINDEIIDEINTGAEHLNVFQWHKSGKILFQTFKGSFYYDVNTKEIKLIAPYFYHPVMSPDGKYVALTRDDRYGILDYTEIVEHGLYRQYSYNEGLYVKNMVTDELTQIAPLVDNFGGWEYSQKPMQWVYVNKEFDNYKYRWCSPTDIEGEFNTRSSTGNAENALDGNPNTAWIEYEERYNTEHEELKEKYDGRGIGEWIKIYKETEARLAYMKFEDGYRTDIELGYLESFCISGIKIINGYAKSKEIYSANNRVKKAEIILSDGTSYIFDLEDNNLGFQTLDFGKEIETRQVVIKILDIYEGSKYNDTCISEVELIGAN